MVYLLNRQDKLHLISMIVMSTILAVTALKGETILRDSESNKKSDRKIPEEKGIPGIAPMTASSSEKGAPYNEQNFQQIGVLDTWRKYHDKLTWGKGQCLALLDDGCDLSVPQWQAEMPWGKKVIVSYNSFDDNDDPTPVPPGYHGTTVGYPSSLNHDGIRGIAYNNFVAQVRCVTIVHLPEYESKTMAAALRWVLDNHDKYNITAVNLSPLDDKPHKEPVPTEIDDVLKQLRKLNIWVSAPCGNNQHTDGISWPACQPYCFAIGATIPGTKQAHLDRYKNTDILVCAVATSSSNAYAAACSMILREAIEKSGYEWKADGETLPDAMMAIFKKTGNVIHDPATDITFRELNLLKAVDHVYAATK